MSRVSFDIIIPTYNRGQSIEPTLRSILRAKCPADVDLNVIVVDNNSNEGNGRAYIAAIERCADPRIRYTRETRQGRSQALNCGLARSSADLVGFIDDDEQVGDNWIETASRELREPTVAYVGGPCLPDWEEPPPNWLPAKVGRFSGVIGWIESSREPVEFRGIPLSGGNFAIKRKWLSIVGPFPDHLGRDAGTLLGGEEVELHERLVEAGARGRYLPDMRIYHFVPRSRLTRRYHVRWAFWAGVSRGLRFRYGQKQRALFGVPVHRYGRLLRSALGASRGLVAGRGRSASVFADALDCVAFFGILYGCHAYGRRPNPDRSRNLSAT